MVKESYAEQLRERLQVIENKMMELIDVSVIRRFRNDPDSVIVFITPEYYWDKPDDRQKTIQMELKNLYLDWIEHVNLLTGRAPDSLTQEVHGTDVFVRTWIEKESSWDVPDTLEKAKKVFLEKIQPLHELLRLYNSSASHEIILVPDTNAIISTPEIAKFKNVVGGEEKFILQLTPTVLAELDELKIKSRDNAFREKVKLAINRIKGWRTQGSLLSGVIVNKTIMVKMIAKEPDFSHTLHWLDPANNDDRIIASVLEIQRSYPSCSVYLVTSDINLQSKAELANLPYVEPPNELVPRLD